MGAHQPEAGRVLQATFVDLERAARAVQQGTIGRYIEKPWDEGVLIETLQRETTPWRLSRQTARLRDQLVERERTAAVEATRDLVLHDVRNSTQSIELALAVLEDELRPLAAWASSGAPGTRFGPSLANVRTGVDHLMALLGELSARSTDQVRPTQPISIEDTFSLVRRLVRPLRPPRTRIDYHCPPGLKALGDSLDVTRIVHNLVTNAVTAIRDAHDGQGHIRVTARRVGPMVLVMIADDGPGLPQKVRSKLFAPFNTSPQSPGRAHDDVRPPGAPARCPPRLPTARAPVR